MVRKKFYKSDVGGRLRHYIVLLIVVLGCMSLQPAAAKTVQVNFDPRIEDYAPLVQKALDEVYAAGGGAVEIGPGAYPLKSTVGLTHPGNNLIEVTIRGLVNAAGEVPLLYYRDATLKPYSFFVFRGDVNTPRLSIFLSDIAMQGNNVPMNRSKTNVPGDDGVTTPWEVIPFNDIAYDKTYGHPWIYRKDTGYDAAVRGIDIQTLHANNVTIRDFYGNGIMLSNYGELPEQGVQSPRITNCKLLNVWQWHAPDDAGDAIMLWHAANPVVENNVIFNDMAFTRWMGRCGLVLEHLTSNASVKDNLIGGYARNIHIELTLGGHEIVRNRLLSSDIGIVFNEPRGGIYDLPPSQPVTIKDNYFEYKREFAQYRSLQFGGRRAFIDFTTPSPLLEGSVISDNKMLFASLSGEPLVTSVDRFITTVIPAEGLTVVNNQFDSADSDGNITSIAGGTSPVWPPVNP